MAKDCEQKVNRTGLGWAPVRSILVMGARGMLGCDLCRALEASSWGQAGSDRRITAWDYEELDITQEQAVRDQLGKEQPDLVINCAAYTDVDGSEQETETAFAVNATGTLNLARACAQMGAKLVHVSTDFIFDGRAGRPYREDDTPNAINVYGGSKWAGEEHIRNVMPLTGADDRRHLIVRTSWLFGKEGKNFVETILAASHRRDHLEVVDDQTGCPTYGVDLAEALLSLVGMGAGGTYHFRNGGHCSWFEFAAEIVRQAEVDCQVRPIASDALARPAQRPPWSVLDIAKYENATGRSPRRWQDALRAYLACRNP